MRPSGARALEDVGPARSPVPVAAVIVPCSSRKARPPTERAQAVSLPSGPQRDVETAWRERLGELDPVATAGSLYAGRGAKLARQAAGLASAPLFVISAGLGLVEGGRMVPSYNVTVGARGPGAIASRIEGRFDPRAWWSAVTAGPMSTSLAAVVAGSDRSIALLALTRSYASLLAGDLERLAPLDLNRLRIFGRGLDAVLPAAARRCVMPYDDRLDGAMLGTRTDFSQRALVHFATEVLPSGPGDAADHDAAVARALSSVIAPARPSRGRASDEQIMAWLATVPDEGVGRLLRRLRDEGVACEQRRFSRIRRSVACGERGEAA